MKVLISPGFGAGWSTWNDYPELATDDRLIKAFEDGCTSDEMEELCIKCGYDDYLYMGGFNQLKVVEVPAGSTFKIVEYDGSESIEIFNRDNWLYAED